jgi:predicted anti-sigma-YlaC factor YlaD
MMINGKSNRNKPPMDCAEFQERLPELFESGEDLKNDEHLQTCENCRALVQDLEYIAQQAKLLLPIHDPSPQVWDNIQTALKRETSGAK